MADGDLLARFDSQHGIKANTQPSSDSDLLAAFDKSLIKPYGAGNPPPGATEVEAPRKPGFFEGSYKALLGIPHALANVGLDAGDVLAGGLEKGQEAAQAVLDTAAGIKNLAAMPRVPGAAARIAQPEALGQAFTGPKVPDIATPLGDLVANTRHTANEMYTPNPATTGTLGNTGFGLTDFATRAGLGGLFGPEVSIGVPAATMGVERTHELENEGVDPVTAQKSGAVEAGLLALLGGVPGVGKNLATKLAVGAGSNLALGAGTRAADKAILQQGGYDKLASQSPAWDDPKSAVLDALIGAAFPAIHAGVARLNGGEAAKKAAEPVAAAQGASEIEQALRAAGFTDEQIADFERSGAMDETLRAATQAPPLQGSPPEAPPPVAAIRSLSAPEPKAPEAPRLPPPPRRLPPPTIEVDSQGRAVTNAQAMAEARRAEAAEQMRRSLGLTPDVERARDARIEGQIAWERAGVGPERPTPEIPEGRFPEAREAATEPPPGVPEPKRQFQPVRAQNGQIMRDAKGRPLREPVLDLSRDHLVHWLAANGGINFKSLRASADVDPALLKDPDVMRPFGRIGDPALRRNGGMTVDQAVTRMQEAGWLPENDPNAPPKVGHNEATSLILDALNGHEITHPIEGVDERLQRQADEHYAGEAERDAELAADREAQTDAERTEDVRALRERNAEFADTDAADALTVDQWVQHAREAGVPDTKIRNALSREDWAPTLHRLIQERGNGTDGEATTVDHGRGNAAAGGGQIAEPGPAPHGAQRGDLFPAATSADQLRAATEAKDAERNGLNRPSRPFTGSDLGATPHGEAPEQVDLTTPEAQSTTYERDTGHVQRNGASEPAAGNVSAARAVPGQLDLFVATRGDRPVPKAEAPKLARLFQRAKVVTTGAFKSGIKVIRGWQDAAHIIAPLRKYPQEQFLAVVADAEGHPLAVLRHTIGTRDGSLVDAGNVFGSIAQIPGAKQVWFAHNHPSGHMQQSAADLRQTQRLHDLMRGSGIEARGMIQIGPGSREATYSNPKTGERGQQPSGKITPAARTGEVPIVERALRKVASGERPQLRSPSDLPRLVKEVAHGETGAILLDNRHRVVGFLPMSDAEMAHLRTGDPATGAAHVAAVSNEATAAAVVMAARDAKAARNLGTFFADAGIHPLDIAVIGEHGQVSSQSWGTSTRTDGLPFASEEPRPARGQEAQDNVNEVAESDLSPADRELVQRTRARAAQAKDNRDAEAALEQDSRERGEREAGELGLRGAVVEALGPDRMDNVHFVHDADGLPEDVRRRGKPIKRGNVRYGLHTADGHSYIFTKRANTPERAVWTAIHEVGGHEGIAALVREHPDVKVGARTAKEASESARKLFLQNPTVAKLAEVIGRQRGSKDLPRMAEEAMAELQAAKRTGRWDEIARKYGVDVPKSVRDDVQGAMANFVRRMKAIVNAIYRKLTGAKGDGFTDADVHDMLDSMWEASRGERAGTGEHLASEEPQGHAQTDTPAFKLWFGDSKVVDADGKPLAVYHGATRPDRINNRFRKTRATSGPMAFFTDDPNIASSYAKGKPDTSLEPPADYAEWFKYKVPGSRSEVPIDRAWHHLSPDKRAEIAAKLPHVSRMDAEGNDAPLHLGGQDDYGLAGKAHWDYEIKKARGNVLEAAKEVWLNSGALFNDEPEFMKVLRLGGMDMGRTRFDDPWAQSPAVFKTFLSIKDPLDTSRIPTAVLDALEKRARRQPAPKEYGADIWAKQTRDARDWIQQLREDVASGTNSTVWTSIPDWVSRILKEFGYDGIKDTGGKNGGDGHDVWIPFDDRQVKSATGNRGTFDAEDPRIDYSEEPQERADTIGRGAGGVAIEPEPAAELPPRAPGESQPAYHARVMRESRQSMKDGLMRAVGIEPQSAAAKAVRDIGRGGLRAMWARSQRAGDRAAAAFAQAMAVFDKMGKDANLLAIDQWESGQPVTSAAHRLFFKAMDKAFNDRIEAVRKIAPGTLERVIENYFPHLWEDPTRAAKWYQQMATKRPLEGNKSFLKQRIHATIKDGMAAGLKPVSTNPVDLVLAKMAQMDKFIALHQFRRDLQARGWLKEMEPGERVPYGYARVDDPAFMKAAGLQGYFAVPELIARDLNNYLGPSLYRFRGFKALRKLENLIMMARLGWSAFHAGFTTLDNLVMHADVGLRYMLHGDMKRALTTLAKTPLSVVWSPVEGGRLNRQWLGLDKADVHTAALLDALEQGGARWKMSRTDYNNDLPKFIRSLRQRDYGTSVKTALSAIGEVGSWLIHHKLVPNQKMAARLLLAKFALDRVAGQLGKERGDYAGIIEAMHPDALKQIMGRVVNDVDDRLGQMTYDNQFWNKTARELAQTVIGAVGWQVGTVRTVTGGVRDIRRLWSPEKLLSSLDKDGKITDADMGRISGRLTYLISLALISGGSSAALQYMLTGEGPSEVKDYFFPKTGRKNPDGSDERLQFPSYWMDHYKLATHPIQTAEHKLHPILSMFFEAVGNQDYYGVEIRDPHAPWWKQAEQVGEYVAKGFVPYSWTSNRKAASNEAGIGRQAASFVGIVNAPASVSRSPFQRFVSHNGNKGFGHEKRTQADAEHSRQIHDLEADIRNGATPDLSHLSRRDLLRVRRESRVEVPEIQFKKMAIEDKLDAWDMATPAERKRYHLRRDILTSRGTQTDRFRRLPHDERDAILKRIHEIRANP